VSDQAFWSDDGLEIPALTAAQMREVDRIAVEEFDLSILQMMENAARNLAQNVMDMLGQMSAEVTVLAGAGGNGGGGLCGARHLHNRGFNVNLVLDRGADALRGCKRLRPPRWRAQFAGRAWSSTPSSATACAAHPGGGSPS